MRFWGLLAYFEAACQVGPGNNAKPGTVSYGSRTVNNDSVYLGN